MAPPMLQLDRPEQPSTETQAPGTQPAPANLSEIFQRAGLTEDLAAIEQLLVQRAGARAPLLAAAGAHTIAAGGKRLRAALVLLAARLGHYDLERAAHP